MTLYFVDINRNCNLSCKNLVGGNVLEPQSRVETGGLLSRGAARFESLSVVPCRRHHTESAIPNLWKIINNMGLNVKKPVFGVSDLVRHKQGCTVKDG